MRFYFSRGCLQVMKFLSNTNLYPQASLLLLVHFRTAPFKGQMPDNTPLCYNVCQSYQSELGKGKT